MSEFIHHFGIDWRLLIAQIINFGVLFFLLKKFAYGPILAVLRERRRKIEEGLELRRQAQRTLHSTEQLREEVLTSARHDAVEIVHQAESTAENRHEEIIQEAHKKVEHIISDARRVIEGEKQKMNKEVIDEAEAFVRTAIERIIGNMPPAQRDKVLIREALTELRKT